MPQEPAPKNRVPENVEQVSLDLILAERAYGSQRIANELRLQGANVSPSGGLHHELETRYKGVVQLETAARE